MASKEKNIEKDINEIMDYIKDLKEENRKQKEILEILKKYIVYDKELNAIKCDGFVLTKTHRKEDYEKIVRWLENDK